MEVTLEQLATWRADSLWGSTLDVIFSKVNRNAFHSYFECLKPVRLSQGMFTIQVSEGSVKNIIEKKYQQILLESLQEKLSTIKSIRLIEKTEENLIDNSDLN